MVVFYEFRSLEPSKRVAGHVWLVTIDGMDVLFLVIMNDGPRFESGVVLKGN